MDVTNNEYFRTIRKAIENRKLALFVGSAVSYDSDLPSWGQLVSQMKSALDIARTDDYLKIAEHYYLQYGRNTYYNKINEFFPSGAQPNQLHEIILSLKPQHIITTNWDDLLEKVINNKGELYFPVTNDHELASAPTSQLLVKMHGDLTHRNIVFKESDYLSYSENFPLIENFVKSLFSTHVVIFVGYSISDYNLNQIISWIRHRTNDAPPAFTVLTENKITLSESNYLRDKGIYPILTNTLLIDEEKYPSLSDKSNNVAKIIERITKPEPLDIPDILSEIAKDISNWKAVHPSNIVQLIRDRINITEINKIYYSAESNTINYRIRNDNLEFSRSSFRNIRKDLVKILSFIPVRELRIHVRSDLYYKIVNRTSFSFRNEYTEFNFKEISDRVSSININSINDIDKQYKIAYDNYFLKRLSIARESFTHIANLYFSKSLFIKSLISSFNKKQLCFGEIPWNLHRESFLEISQSESLSQNDNIAETIERFPKSILNRQKSLFQQLDSNNSFLLERFRIIATLSRKIDNEIEEIKNGSVLFSTNVNAIYNQAYYTVLFIIENKITVIYSESYRSINRIAFEAIIKRLCINDHLNKKPSIEINEFLVYMAISSFSEKELSNFLRKNLLEDKLLEYSEESFSYMLMVLENSLKEIISPSSSSTRDYSAKIWKNLITLLSYMKISESNTTELIQNIVKFFDANDWHSLSDTVNSFLVLQVNRNKSSFLYEDIQSLFSKQIEKLNSHNSIPYREKGRLFNSLLYLMNEKSNSEDLLKENKEIGNFIKKITDMPLKNRVNVIDGFVFSIYSISNGDLKKEISNLLLSTYNELINEDFNERAIVLGLDLYLLKILNDKELYRIFDTLKILVEKSLESGSTNGYYSTIQEQIENIEKNKLENYQSMIEDLSELSKRMDNIFLNPI
ncbi:TPA: hypothetical protein I7122_05660 [Vibrio vulnificus]|nr:hypothetical protein [Vibrio vulnificus]